MEDGVGFVVDVFGGGLWVDFELVGYFVECGLLWNFEVFFGDGGDECFLLFVGDVEVVDVWFVFCEGVDVFDVEFDGFVLIVVVEFGECCVVVEFEVE